MSAGFQNFDVLAELVRALNGAGGSGDDSGRLIRRAALILFGRDFDRCTSAERRQAADLLDALIDDVYHLEALFEAAALRALELADTPHDDADTAPGVGTEIGATS